MLERRTSGPFASKVACLLSKARVVFIRRVVRYILCYESEGGNEGKRLRRMKVVANDRLHGVVWEGTVGDLNKDRE